MSGQWEKYVEQGTDALRVAGFVDPDDDTVPTYRGNDPIPVWVPAEYATRAFLDALGPLIAEDTRVRLVAAAGRSLKRDDALEQMADQHVTYDQDMGEL